MSTTAVKFRRADPGDKEAIQRISADAYVPAYMAILGRSQNRPQRITGRALKRDRFGFWKLKVSQQGSPFWKNAQIIYWSTA